MFGPCDIFHNIFHNIFHMQNAELSILASKEDVFKSKALIEKRQLMIFLMFASGNFDMSDTLRGKEGIGFSEFLKGPDFGLSAELASVVAYALAHCSEESGDCVITRYIYFCFRADYFQNRRSLLS
jgi:hypothetical protein